MWLKSLLTMCLLALAACASNPPKPTIVCEVMRLPPLPEITTVDTPDGVTLSRSTALELAAWLDLYLNREMALDQCPALKQR